MRPWGLRVLWQIFHVNGKLYFFLASLLTQLCRCILNKTECVKASGHGHACQACMRAKQRCEGGTFGSGAKLTESTGSTRGLQVAKVLGDIAEFLCILSTLTIPPPHSTPTSFHILLSILSIFHIPSLSPFHDLLLVARLSVPYVVTLHLGVLRVFSLDPPCKVCIPKA